MKHHKKLLFWLLSYPIGLFLFIFLLILDKLGKIKIIGQENIRNRRGLIIASNHPSLWEPIVMYYLFMPELFYKPWITPLSMVDKINYGQNYLWLVFWPLFISIDRMSGKAVGAYKNAEKHLLDKGNLIVFPEGGRTSSGDQRTLIRYYNGQYLKPLQAGVCSLAHKTKSLVVPVWVDGSDKVLPRGKHFPRFWKKMTISIGKPYKVSSDTEKAKKRLSSRILDLYNKINPEYQ